MTPLDAGAPSGLIAYVDPDGQLAWMTPDGLNKRRLTGGSSRVESADWSPDGRQIAYIAGASADANRQVAICDLDRQQVTTLSLTIADPWVVQTMSGAHWSPNGRYLLLDSGTGELRDLTVVDPNTGGTKATVRAYGYAWSPDGERLAIGEPHPLATPIRLGNGDSRSLSVLTIGDQAPNVLLEGTDQDLYDPRIWLSNGELLFEQITWNENAQTSASSRWLVDPDSGVLEPKPAKDIPPDRDHDLVLARLPKEFQDASSGVASRSPDGNWLVFAAASGARRGMYVLKWTSGAEPRRIADGTSPVWQPH